MLGSTGVLVFGLSDAAANTGLEADKRAVVALQVPAATVEAVPTVHRTQIDHAIQGTSCKVVKIGAMASEQAIKMVAEVLQQNGTELMSVMDVEPFFKTSPAPPKPEVVTALRKDLLPSITLLSSTVPEVMELLRDAGISADYPRGIPDVQALAQALARNLGPQYVIIKREFVDEDDGATTLHYVLAGRNEEPAVMVTSRCENPERVRGASYSIPPAIAAYLAKGYTVPEAVRAGFEFIGEMLKGGDFFQ